MLGTRSEHHQDPWKWFRIRGPGPRLSYAIILLCLAEALVWTYATSGAFVAVGAEETTITNSFQQFASASAENFKIGDVHEEAGAGQTRAGIASLAKEGRHFSVVSKILQAAATKVKPHGTSSVQTSNSSPCGPF